MKFYFGAASGSSRKALRRLEEPNVMINYATQNNQPWEEIENLFIDSGGYSFIKGKGEYETSDREYIEFIKEKKPEMWALRDYPCEPEVVEEQGTSVREHQDMTTERAESLLEIYRSEEVPGRPVTVVQGWKLEDYLRHIRELRERDLLTEYVGIGSVCRRGQDEEIRRIINGVRKELPDKKLHAFGVKTNVLRFQDIQEALYSADSMAYEFSAQWNNVDRSKNWRHSAIEYLKMKNRLERTLEKNDKQSTISDF